MVNISVIRGSTIRITNTIKDFDGTAITPTSQLITIKDPGGATQDTSTTPTETSTGVYYYNYETPTNGTVGTWTVEWKVTYGLFDSIERATFTLAA